jgi:hypothetical protein
VGDLPARWMGHRPRVPLLLRLPPCRSSEQGSPRADRGAGEATTHYGVRGVVPDVHRSAYAWPARGTAGHARSAARSSARARFKTGASAHAASNARWRACSSGSARSSRLKHPGPAKCSMPRPNMVRAPSSPATAVRYGSRLVPDLRRRRSGLPALARREDRSSIRYGAEVLA